MLTIICNNSNTVKEVESDLRFLYFHDYDEPFIKWTRKGNTFYVQNDMNDISGEPGYVRQYVSKRRSVRFK